MGFKRPLVQIQSLGPKTGRAERLSLFFGLSGSVRTPAASCHTIMAALRPWRRPSPHRPLVQIQSLGPKRQGVPKGTPCLFGMWSVRTPAASCFSINGRFAAVAAFTAAAAAGSNPVTRTKKTGDVERRPLFSWSSFSAAQRREDPLRSNRWEGKSIPSQTHPMRFSGAFPNQNPAKRF